MMRERLIVLVNTTTNERTKHVDFERKTGIKRSTVKSLLDGKQRFNEEHITAIAKAFPQYRVWFALGETYPDIGQTSPDLEAISKEYPQEEAG